MPLSNMYMHIYVQADVVESAFTPYLILNKQLLLNLHIFLYSSWFCTSSCCWICIYLCTLPDSEQAAVVESAYSYVLYLILYKQLLLNLHIFMYSTWFCTSSCCWICIFWATAFCRKLVWYASWESTLKNGWI